MMKMNFSSGKFLNRIFDRLSFPENLLSGEGITAMNEVQSLNHIKFRARLIAIALSLVASPEIKSNRKPEQNNFCNNSMS